MRYKEVRRTFLSGLYETAKRHHDAENPTEEARFATLVAMVADVVGKGRLEEFVTRLRKELE